MDNFSSEGCCFACWALRAKCAPPLRLVQAPVSTMTRNWPPDCEALAKYYGESLGELEPVCARRNRPPRECRPLWGHVQVEMSVAGYCRIHC
eukprot:6323142-Pyramimonas_sp.AAC.1